MKFPAFQPEYRVTGKVEGVIFSTTVKQKQLGNTRKYIASLASKVLKQKVQPDYCGLKLISVSRISETSYEEVL